MRYASIRELDISNGEGVGVSLFVQGCHFHCENCFNQETWDFDGGKEWTKEIEEQFLDLIDKPYIQRISILGGEPLAEENVFIVCELVHTIRFLFPKKTIWIYSGYTWEEIFYDNDYSVCFEKTIERCRKNIIGCSDVLVDGRFKEDKKDLTLKFRGSSNQRIINIEESFDQEKVVLYYDEREK